jgi:hypothetical protein
VLTGSAGELVLHAAPRALSDSSMNERGKDFKGHRNLLRLRGRGRLLALLEDPVLLARLDVASDGRLVPETCDWPTFWAPVHQLADPQLDRALDALHAAWQDYIRSSFDRSLQREYCFRYFRLLDLVLATEQDSCAWRHALRAVVGFECFGLRAPALGSQVLAAGTTTLRNPCYLLAKLKWPDVPDDTRFLPLIAVGDGASANLFSHYRQYWLSATSPMSLLVYLSNSPALLSASLRLVGLLAKILGSGRDPFVKERSERLWHKAFGPITQAAYAGRSGPICLEFVDVGAGSGALTAALCRKLLVWSVAAGFSPRFRLWFVDLCLADPARFFRTADVRSRIDSLMFLGDDYRGWLARPRPLPVSSGLRVALVLKVFDALGHFSIDNLRTNVLPSVGVVPESFIKGKYLPGYCLGAGGLGPEGLMVSYSRVVLAEGRTFAQASLSRYYAALRLASAVQSGGEMAEGEVCLPVKALDPECLVVSDGASVLARLLEHCDYLIVEDADLRPTDLVEHLRTFSLRRLAACDMTKAMGLTGNYAYVLWPRADSELPVSGERLW